MLVRNTNSRSCSPSHTVTWRNRLEQRLRACSLVNLIVSSRFTLPRAATVRRSSTLEHVGARPSHKVNPGLRPPFIERIVEITSVDDHNGPRSKLQLPSNPYVVGVAVGHQCPTGQTALVVQL